MKQLYFIRHGEAEGNKTSRWLSVTDSPLSQLGKKQAKNAGILIKQQDISFDIIVSSPLIRAHHTAVSIATEIEYPVDQIIVNDLLMERTFGELEGKHHSIAAAKYMIGEDRIDKFKGVESLESLQNRADEFFAFLQTLSHDNVLVVGHGATGRALTRAVRKQPVHVRNVRYKNAELVRLI